MGTLLYGGSDTFDIDDRVLAHLRVAVMAKPRRQQGFMLNWTVPAEHGGGRVSLWNSPGVPIEYRFSGSKQAQLNRVWPQALERSSQGLRRMVLISESEGMSYLESSGSPEAP